MLTVKVGLAFSNTSPLPLMLTVTVSVVSLICTTPGSLLSCRSSKTLPGTLALSMVTLSGPPSL
ncbi:hypothetical protein D3C85_1534680 [compost metagenome]